MSLSFPSTQAKQIKSLAKKRGHNSISAYIQYLVTADKDLISESELIKTVKEARKEYKAGKSIKAKSLADLI